MKKTGGYKSSKTVKNACMKVLNHTETDVRNETA